MKPEGHQSDGWTEVRDNTCRDVPSAHRFGYLGQERSSASFSAGAAGVLPMRSGTSWIPPSPS